jgi:hypothetical protein
MCTLANVITIKCAFRRCLRSLLGDFFLVFALLLIANFRFPLNRVGIEKVLARLLVWGVRGDFLLAFSFV